ncbi:hypothetical protein [Emticicia sp. 17c]|uniref:hypothetical protein n=1 Tax=Emticicia sp. 17c TaxID=3127704 RepID=UPI00301D7996
MKKVFFLSVLICSFLTACHNDAKDIVAAQCYQDNPIEELPWLNAVVTSFQKPKSGPLTVSSYSFKNTAYLVVANPSVSCPACYIYNCEGKTIGQLGISYETFMSEGKTIKTFLNATY